MSRYTLIASDGTPAAPGSAHVAVVDTTTQLMWSAADVSDSDLNHADATQACADLKLAGHADWRLPTIQELLTLVDYDQRRPAVARGIFLAPKFDAYWSASPLAALPNYAWLVSFYVGRSDFDQLIYGYGVRAVRSAAGDAR